MTKAGKEKMTTREAVLMRQYSRDIIRIRSIGVP